MTQCLSNERRRRVVCQEFRMSKDLECQGSNITKITVHKKLPDYTTKIWGSKYHDNGMQKMTAQNVNFEIKLYLCLSALFLPLKADLMG